MYEISGEHVEVRVWTLQLSRFESSHLSAMYSRTGRSQSNWLLSLLFNLFLCRLKNSPLTMVLVISILVMYFLLLGFFVKADRHDKKKLGVIFLDDSTTFDANSQSRYLTSFYFTHIFCSAAFPQNVICSMTNGFSTRSYSNWIFLAINCIERDSLHE